ncbi:MAG: LCP family protein [Chitinophagales bacterium]
MKNFLFWVKNIFIVCLLFGTAFIAGCIIPGLVGYGVPGVTSPTKPDVMNGERVNVLLLGIDARPGEVNTRSDTMILACIDPTLGKVALVSIPRDSRVELPGRGINKINAANALGGPEEACSAVEELMGVPVDYYVLTNFGGFSKMVDILGGVTIDVEKRMYKPSEHIDLQKGVQHLNGYNALGYVRFRGDALGDIGRTQRQQEFMTAFARELMQSKTILKLPRLLPELKKNVKTDMNVKTMILLARMASGFKPESLISQTLPGYFYNDPATGASYWEVDRDKATTLVASLMDGQKIDVIEDTPYQKVARNTKKKAENSDLVAPEEPIIDDPGTVEEPANGDEITQPEDPTNPGVPNSSEPQEPSQVYTPYSEGSVITPSVEAPSEPTIPQVSEPEPG